MDRLKHWLELHKLGGHYETFVANSIDLDVVPLLDAADFDQLGLNLGDRKRLIRAIRDLRQDATIPVGLSERNEPFLAASRPDSSVAESAEKLQLTMIFVDLVGSTALSQELDLEEFRDVIHRYQVYALDVIRRHHGFVAQFIGDAVTAYFGYPIAAEDDAESAVLAGLEICDGVTEVLSFSNRAIQVRVGIATGELVVEEQSIREGLAFGDTPNLAARIMTATQPGTVAISDRTKRLLGATVECEWLGKKKLKGFDDPKGVWRVRNATQTGLRFRARQKGAILPMVNREEELQVLENRWRSVCSKQPQTVLLSGEAGIGKSRLVAALIDRIEADVGQRLDFQCSEHHRGNAYFPLVSLINMAASIRRSDTPDQQASKLRRLLKTWFSQAQFEDAWICFSSLLLLQVDPVETASEVTPKQLKTRLQRLLVDLAIRLSDQKPLLLLFEDLHWVDPSSEELIDLLIEKLSAHRVMIICTSRPEYKLRWTGLSRVTTLPISRLDDQYSHEMMRNALGSDIVPAPIEAQIIDKSEGVPLFLEELARMVRRRLDQPDAMSPDQELDLLPSTLKDLLRAKIDGLVTAREIVPVCAAIGRTIYPSMVQRITGISFDEARAQLDYLSEVDILVPRGNQPDRSYAFRHALIRDAGYNLMLKSRARKLHRAIGEVIVASYPDLALQQPDVLALHYTRANMPAEARDAWRKAATQSAGRAATEETIRHLENALRQNEKVQDAEARVTEEIALRKMFNVALNTRAFGSHPVLENITRLNELLLDTAAEPEDAFLALHEQFGAQLMLGDVANALGMCDAFERISEKCNDPTMQAITAHNKGMGEFMRGAFSDAIAFFEQAHALAQRCQQDDILRYHAADIRPVDQAMRCWAFALRGDAPTEVRAAIELATSELATEKHAFSRCFALNILASSYQPLGDTDALLDLVGRAVKISDAHDFQYWGPWSAVIRGWAHAVAGDPALGIGELQSGLDAYLALGSTQLEPFAKTLLADAYLRCGDLENARATIESMKKKQREGGIAYHLGLAARIEAEIRAANADAP